MSEDTDAPLAYCGAKCKRTGLPCRHLAGKNGRCRLHGGRSTGAKTKAGKALAAKANLKHGFWMIQEQCVRRIFAKNLKTSQTQDLD